MSDTLGNSLGAALLDQAARGVLKDPSSAVRKLQAQKTAAEQTANGETKGNVDLEEAKEAAQDFEAVFLAQMLQPMFEGLGSDGIFGGGHAEKIHRSLLVQEYGKEIAKQGGVGLADQVLKEIVRLQENSE